MASANPSATKSSLLINHNFGLLWFGQTISTIGDYIFNPTLILWIGTRIAVDQSWSPLAVSGVLIVTAIPTLIIGPFAGVFVDRWNKRKTMIGMDSGRALINLLLVLITGSVSLPFIGKAWITPQIQIGTIYAAVFFATVCAQFFNPSSLALLGDIVEKDKWARASGLQEATSGLAIILGLSFAAPLFFGLGVQWALLLNSLSFVVSFITILSIRTPARDAIGPQPVQQPRKSFFREYRAGFDFYRQNHVLMTILVADGLFVFGVNAHNALNFFFTIQNLHASAALFGYLNAAFGLGALIGALIVSRWAQKAGLARTFWIALLSAGVLFLIYARLTNIVPAFLIFFAIGLPNAAINVVVSPLLLSVTPREFIGRVSAVLRPTLSFLRILSTFIAGYLASTLHFQTTIFTVHVSLIDTIFTTTGLFVLAAGFYALINLPHHSIPDHT